MSRHPERPFCVVVWDDAVGDMVGRAHEIQHAPERCQTYGWLLRSDAAGVSIAGDWVETNDTYRGITFIPRNMVIEERPLALARPRARRSAHSSVQKKEEVK